jgi:flap endonuclease-1
MGVKLRDLVVSKNISLDDLKGKTLIVDGHNMLYQFLTTIRARDGAMLTASSGAVTSHLIGLFSRVTKLMQKGIKLAFVFDGTPPEIKHKELERRKELKIEAKAKYEKALAEEDVDTMRKFAVRTSRLTPDMVASAKVLLSHLGIPYVQAPSEGEAQASYMVAKGDAWAVSSQDFDSLLYGTPYLIQNLSIEGKRKLPGKFAYTTVEPKLIDLKATLKQLNIDREKLIWLSILVGTDYNPKGVARIGPKKGLALVQQHDTAESLFSSVELVDDVSWNAVLDTFHNMKTTDDYKLEWNPVDRDALFKFLVDDHDFSPERVDKTLDKLCPEKGQAKLGDF